MLLEESVSRNLLLKLYSFYNVFYFQECLFPTGVGNKHSGFVLVIYSKTQKIQISIYIHIQIPTILTHHTNRLGQ